MKWQSAIANGILALSFILLTALSATAGEARFVFRMKMGYVVDDNTGGGHTKDIVAYFVGGVGYAFSERLPMKAEWEDDTWVVRPGHSLPDGITFNASTLTFEGTPTEEGLGTVVELDGYDSTGTKVASAVANFDIHTIKGKPVQADYYARTGKYRFIQLDVPTGITIDRWRTIYSPPPGVDIIGRNFDGTPSKAGEYRYFIQGLDFLGETVATFWGTYVVEDRPTFPKIADFVRPLPQLEWGWALRVDFGAPSTHAVRYAMDTPANVRYFLEFAEGETLPGTVSSNDNPRDLRLEGWINEPYDTALVRYKAIDSDGIPGYSNWFRWGSGDPQPTCNPFVQQGAILRVVTGQEARIPIPRPFGAEGEVHYHLIEGELPKPLVLEELSGLIVGTPEKPKAGSDIRIRIDVVNPEGTVSTECAYSIESINGSLNLSDGTGLQSKHIRIGAPYEGTVSVVGGIPTYSVDFAEGQTHDTLAITSQKVDSSAVTVEGTMLDKGLPHLVNFTVKNGDDNERTGPLRIYAHPPISAPDVPTVTVQQYAASGVWHRVQYDNDTIVPDTSGATQQPIIRQANGTQLPFGVNFDGRAFSGTPMAAPGLYGPYVLEIKDFTGESSLTNVFKIEVTERDDIVVTDPVTQTFTVTKSSTLQPSRAIQPPGASELEIEWSIDGPIEPWMSFDRGTGAISVSGTVFEEIGSYGPFTVTATDSEGYADTSEPFMVDIVDLLPPAAKAPGLTVSNVSGEQPVETRTKALAVIDDTIIGSVDEVSFAFEDNNRPGGLDIDADTGVIHGFATETYDGIVKVRITDSKGRSGITDVPVRIRPFPAIEVEPEFSLPRLSSAADMGGLPNGGFYGWIAWSLDATSAPLPKGLYVNTTDGSIQGITDAPENTYAGIVLKAHDAGGSDLSVTSAPFAIIVTPRVAMTASYGGTIRIELNDSETGNHTLNRSFAAQFPGVIAGSRVNPVRWELVTPLPDGLNGIGINSTNGIVTGHPAKLGRWNVSVLAKDSDDPQSAAVATADIWATLSGYVERVNGGGAITVRSGQTFHTEELVVKNKVGEVTYSTHQRPPELDFADKTGKFLGRIYSDRSDVYDYSVWATDADGRGFASSGVSPVFYRFNVVQPLQLPMDGGSYAATQYDPEAPIDISFPKPFYQMGEKISYEVEGEVPGTLVHALYDDNGIFTGYSTGVTSAEDLPLDAIVLDPVKRTLKGIPSKDGSFDIRIVATDDHMDTYEEMGDPKRVDFNTAKSGVLTINVERAPDLKVTNTADSETIYQYTTSPTIVSTVEHAAYGKPVSWVAVSGKVPDGIGVIRLPKTATYSGYPTKLGTFDNIVWKAVDVAEREASAPPVSFTVEPRKQLELHASTAIPRYMIVFETDAQMTVTPRYAAYGKAIGIENWTVGNAGNLPPGVTYEIKDNSVVFKGTSDVIGVYEGITVSAVDSLGSAATIAVKFVVMPSPDPIEMNTYNVVTKVGYPAVMDPPFAQNRLSVSNTYGNVRFYSYDLAAIPELRLDGKTGAFSGTFSSVRRVNFDLYVTDDTNRVTSKPVTIDVIPDLRVVVQSFITAKQGVEFERDVDTDYMIGTVTYEKGNPTAWPEGFDVDPATGQILSSKVLAKTGTYAGLTIIGTDRFGTHVDREPSNTFAIKVDPTDALPEIANISSNKMLFGEVDTASTPFRPTVTEAGTAVPWQYAGTVYRLNRQLPAGLVFDPTTGEISGTPTAPIIIRDMIITVTSERGDTTTTKPFWFGVKPKGDITARAGQKEQYVLRLDKAYTTDAPLFDNTYGILAYSGGTLGFTPNTSFSTTTGVLTHGILNPADAVRVMTNQPTDGWPQEITVTDEFGRTGKLAYKLKYAPALSASMLDIYRIPASTLTEAQSTDIPSSSGVIGTKSFSYAGLPAGLLYNASTGAIYGTMPAITDPVAVTGTITDSSDGESRTFTFLLKKRVPETYRYWKVDMVTGGIGHAEINEIEMYDLNNVNIAREDYLAGKMTILHSGAKFGTDVPWGRPWGMVNGSHQWNDYFSVLPYSAGTKRAFITYQFAEPRTIQRVFVLTSNSFYGGSAPVVYGSNDNVNWVEIYRHPNANEWPGQFDLSFKAK